MQFEEISIFGWVFAYNIENGVTKDNAVIDKSKKKYIIVSHLQWKAMLSVTILKLFIIMQLQIKFKLF